MEFPNHLVQVTLRKLTITVRKNNLIDYGLLAEADREAAALGAPRGTIEYPATVTERLIALLQRRNEGGYIVIDVPAYDPCSAIHP